MQVSLQVDLACRSLRRGGVISYPTEAVWGLGCDPACRVSVSRLLVLKGRSMAKGLILIGASVQQFAPWLEALPSERRVQILASWPGPVTWVVPNHGLAPYWICGDNAGLAIRVSDHPLVAELCGQYRGPIVSTSANPSGRRAANSELRVRRYFGEALDYILPGRLGKERRPSTVRDGLTGQVLRD